MKNYTTKAVLRHGQRLMRLVVEKLHSAFQQLLGHCIVLTPLIQEVVHPFVDRHRKRSGLGLRLVLLNGDRGLENRKRQHTLNMHSGIITHHLQEMYRSKASLCCILIASTGFITNQVFAQQVAENTAGQKTILSVQAGQLDLGAVKYPCIDMRDFYFFVPMQYCALADTAKAAGPNYSYYQASIEQWTPSTKKPLSYVFGASLQVERFRNSKADHTSFQGNLHVFLGVEGNRFIGVRGGVRLGQSYKADYIEQKTRINPSLRLWAGYRPYAVLQVGLIDSPATGLSVSTFYSLLDINLAWFSPNILGSMKIGLSDVYFDTQLVFGNVEIKIGQKFILLPSVTSIPKTEAGNAELGFGIGASYVFDGR